MSKRKVLLLILLFLIYEALVWGFSIVFLSDSNYLLVGFVLSVCGITLLLVYLLVARMSARGAPAAPEAPPPAPAQAPPPALAAHDEETDSLAALVAEANERLAKSPTLASQRVRTTITGLPLYLLFGSEGSGKTSLFLASGLEPELLAGQVYRDSTVVATRLANLWFAGGALVVEAAGRFFSAEATRWSRFLGYFRRGGSGSKMRKLFGSQPPPNLQGVILCCDVTPFKGVPDTARQAAMARRAQEQLRAVGEVFGVDFPVYVVFTKSDSVTFFSEYFGRLTKDEDQQILGCTLPTTAAAQRSSAEVYAEAETRRISKALNNLYLSLADKRLLFLDREADRTHKPEIYEFPRELKRIRGPLVQFLVDVFRPNPLQPGPMLRGFYFTGTRTVAGTAENLPRKSLDGSMILKVGEATRMFRAEELHRLQEAPREGPGGREALITRWTFVADFFRQVIRSDRSAVGPVYVDRRAQLIRKLVFASIAGIGVLAGLLFINSWYRNRSLLHRVQTAAAQCEQLPANTAPSGKNLVEIDALRGELEKLLDYHDHHPPLFMRFGFYSGEDALDPARRIYFARFREYFLNDVVRRLEAELSGLPPAQSASWPYDTVYADLRAYRTITTSQEAACAPDAAFSAWLFDKWRDNRTLDTDSQRLAPANFDFYVRELKRKRLPDNLQFASKDAEVVARGRAYLAAFKGIEPQYHNIIAQVNQELQSQARLAELTHNTRYRSVLRGPDEVSSAFTRTGWDRVQQLIESAGQGGGDSCVLGAGAGTSRLASLLPGGDVKRQLRDMYIQDYIRHWTDFLTKVGIQPYSGCGDAAAKLEILKDNDSPILAVMMMTAENTTLPKSTTGAAQSIGRAVTQDAKKSFLSRLRLGKSTKEAVKGQVDRAVPEQTQALTADAITQAFQPAGGVFETSPPNRMRWSDGRNASYLNALSELWFAIQNLNRGGQCNAADPNANNQANAAMQKGLSAVDALSRNFNQVPMYDTVKTFLEEPIRGVKGLIETDPTEVVKKKINGGAAELCKMLGPLRTRYPFNTRPEAEDASLDQVTRVFAPQGSALASMRALLADQLVRQGRTWVQKPDAPVKLSPSFMAFFNQMSAISDALFPEGSAQPSMRYKLAVQANPGVKQVTGTLDGDAFSMAAKQYSWPTATLGINLRVEQSGGGSTPLRSYSGPWGIFQLLSGADRHTPGTNLFGLVNVQGGRRSLPQPILPDGSAITLEVQEFPNGVQRAFDRDFFLCNCQPKAAE